MTIDTSREAVERLLDGVTPGPWEAESGHEQQNGQMYWQVTDKHDAIVQNQFCWCQGDHASNARFIAAARELVPALLAERDAALAEVARLSHALAAETAKREAMEVALNAIDYGYGPQHLSKYARDVARTTLAKHGSK